MSYHSQHSIERDNWDREYYTYSNDTNAHILSETGYGYIYADNPDYEVATESDLHN